MNKKVYLRFCVLIVVVLLFIVINIVIYTVFNGIHQQSEKLIIPSSSSTKFEEDLAELEKFEQDKSLENLEQDLGKITEETPTANKKKIDITPIENLKNELNLELSSLANDLSDLESGFINDTSLDNLDNGLTGAVE